MHRETFINRAKMYAINNREKTNAYKSKNKILREEMIAKLPYDFTSLEWEKCLEYFNNRCAYCGAETNMTQDHVVPISKGGGYTKQNIIPACRSCNSSKNNSYMETWYKEKDFFTQERLDRIKEYITSKR